jgi:hypothetical protein
MLFFVVLLTAVLGLGTLAMAGEAGGKIESISNDERMIVLSDGTRISVPDDAAFGQLREGAEVTVSYEERDGKNVATSIELK